MTIRASETSASHDLHGSRSPGLHFTPDGCPTTTAETASRPPMTRPRPTRARDLDHLEKPWACARCGSVARLAPTETCRACRMGERR